MSNFHISLPCQSIEITKQFYVNILGFISGREEYNWIDINVCGNQVTFAERPDFIISTKYYYFDNKQLPIFHLGIVLNKEDWNKQLTIHKDKDYFRIDQSEFMMNEIGEHNSFFIKDPNGYYMEFKTFKNPSEKFKQKNSDLE